MTFEEEIEALPKECRALLEDRDGGWHLCDVLPGLYSPQDVSTGATRPWEVSGLVLLNRGRFHEAVAVFERLYLHQQAHELKTREHVMKGMPLVWMSDCHLRLGRPVLARRFIMLTLIEDAIASGGTVSPEHTGSYFRAAWTFGLHHSLITQYAKDAHRLFQDDPESGAFPEWVLQQLDQEWMTGYSSSEEVDLYPANRQYIVFLLDRLGDGTGKQLELLAEYLLSIMPGCRVYRRKRSHATDYDLVCAMEGVQLDFRGEFGRYFVCECKDWREPAGITEFAKFCRVLDSVKARFGILFSKHGISGKKSGDDAAREQLKVFQDRGVVIVVIDETDLREIASGRNLIPLLRARYESVRLDLES
ncbi:MAG TPA: hypothetical protein VMH05_10145 [Bryobacteraceae bacterium]|nr:hypothetical protein [Bryobacteraceae bacterium]